MSLKVFYIHLKDLMYQSMVKGELSREEYLEAWPEEAVALDDKKWWMKA